jgi:ubiquinone/menaquinone biosynthesis C-methylase UbiE
MNQAVTTDLQVNFNRHERARMDFVSSLRAHVLTRMAPAMREHYEQNVAPQVERAEGRAPETGPEVHAVMRAEKPFKFYSASRNSAQEMVFASVIDGVERQVDRLNAAAANLRATDGSGSLTLDPALALPKNVSDIDVHLAPGGYYSEYGDEDIATGAIYDHSIRVFTFGQFGRDLNDIGSTMANFVRLRFPEFKPDRILDCGCTIGHNTLPWAEAFPRAEVTGIDVAPGVLRYAHARAQSKGISAHFRQMNATEMDFPDESFDVVFSSMFLHELPLKDIRAYLKEAYRVLRPGGLLWTMELPPNSEMGPWESFYLDWDSYYNNEPYYKAFRDQDYCELVTSAGFAADDFLQVTLPRYTFVGEEAFTRDINAPATFDTLTGRMDPKGTRWYGFGAWKRA